MENKIHLYVQESINGWFKFHKGKHTVHLNWDSRKGGFWLSQYAKKLWKNNFMQDFTDILEAITKDNQVINAKYGHLPKGHPDKQYPIAIFSLYIDNEFGKTSPKSPTGVEKASK